MDPDVDIYYNAGFHTPEAHYEIVDVDDGHGHIEQIVITNDPYHHHHDQAVLSSRQEAEADALVNARYGNYKPIFNGVVVIGPQIGKLIFTTLCFVGIGTMLGFLSPIICKEIGSFTFYLGEALVISCIVFLLLTCVTEPGVVPKDFNLNRYLLEIGRNSTSPPTRPGWCRKCQAPRPPRCYHCRECNVCIRRQDMHLLVGGTCVGLRNFKLYLAFNIAASALSFYLVTISTSIMVKILEQQQLNPHFKNSVFLLSDFNLSCVLLFCGAVLVSFPQTGFIMFVYRLYLLSKNRTVREEYRSILRGMHFNPFDRGIILNVWEFLGKKTELSYITRKKNQVGPNLPSFCRWRVARFTNRGDGNMRTHSFGNHDRAIVDFESYVETETTRQLMNTQAKVKSYNSLPLLDNGELPMVPGIRIRRSLYPRPLDLLQQQIRQFQLAQAVPKSITNIRKFKAEGLSQSENCLPETVDGDGILYQARAFQIQRIISCVIRRDRRSLVELARKIDVAGLLGMDYFDPDNIQMIELNNGLPLLTTRAYQIRRSPEQLQLQQQRLLAIHAQGNQQLNQAAVNALYQQPQNLIHRPIPTRTAMGIPQMVAAGLMPNLRRQQQQQQQASASNAFNRLCLHNLNNSAINYNNVGTAPSISLPSPTNNTLSFGSRNNFPPAASPTPATSSGQSGGPSTSRQGIFRFGSYNRRKTKPKSKPRFSNTRPPPPFHGNIHRVDDNLDSDSDSMNNNNVVSSNNLSSALTLNNSISQNQNNQNSGSPSQDLPVFVENPHRASAASACGISPCSTEPVVVVIVNSEMDTQAQSSSTSNNDNRIN